MSLFCQGSLWDDSWLRASVLVLELLVPGTRLTRQVKSTLWSSGATSLRRGTAASTVDTKRSSCETPPLQHFHVNSFIRVWIPHRIHGFTHQWSSIRSHDPAEVCSVSAVLHQSDRVWINTLWSPRTQAVLQGSWHQKELLESPTLSAPTFGLRRARVRWRAWSALTLVVHTLVNGPRLCLADRILIACEPNPRRAQPSVTVTNGLQEAGGHVCFVTCTLQELGYIPAKSPGDTWEVYTLRPAAGEAQVEPNWAVQRGQDMNKSSVWSRKCPVSSRFLWRPPASTDYQENSYI